MADRVVSNAVEDIGQIGLRIDAAHLGGFKDGVDTGGALSPGVGATEQIVFPSEALEASWPARQRCSTFRAGRR